MSTPRKRARDDDGDGDGDGDDDDGDDDAGATRRPLVVDARDATLPDAALWDEHAERGDADALFEHADRAARRGDVRDVRRRDARCASGAAGGRTTGRDG